MVYDALGFLLECDCGHMIGSHFGCCTERNCRCLLDHDTVLALAIRSQYPKSSDMAALLDASQRLPVINRRRPERSSA